MDRDVRERLIRERWMKDEEKEYEDILKIAETAKTSKGATALTDRRLQVGETCLAAQPQTAPPLPSHSTVGTLPTLARINSKIELFVFCLSRALYT